MFQPCSCLKGSFEIGGLDLADAMRMQAEMTILFETREALPEPLPDDWPRAGGRWQPIASVPSMVPWHRRLTAFTGALVLPFVGWGKAPAAWHSVIYNKTGKVIEHETFLCGLDDTSPAEARFWADGRIGRPTAWERLR
jgi:hypothetical protein